MKKFVFSLLALTAFVPALANAEIYLSVEGTRQGKFKGESTSKFFKDRLNVSSVSHEVVSPRDSQTGLATGRRQHKPLTVIRDVGSASPQFFLALATGENLKTVSLEFTSIDQRTGQEQITYTIKLTNAGVASQKAATIVRGGVSVLAEEVSFAYQSIEIEHVPSKTVASDTWTTTP
ncbi:MAG: type VI secretion system tube protein Hcp [Bdellovibrionales bacterium]|nr:type VI secretion system tube protein Hcp [Bdellovibrionales bacterium]